MRKCSSYDSLSQRACASRSSHARLDPSAPWPHFALPERRLRLQAIHQIVNRLQRLAPVLRQRRHQHDGLARRHPPMAMDHQRVDHIEPRPRIRLDLRDLLLREPRIRLQLQRISPHPHAPSPAPTRQSSPAHPPPPALSQRRRSRHGRQTASVCTRIMPRH